MTTKKPAKKKPAKKKPEPKVKLPRLYLAEHRYDYGTDVSLHTSETDAALVLCNSAIGIAKEMGWSNSNLSLFFDLYAAGRYVAAVSELANVMAELNDDNSFSIENLVLAKKPRPLSPNELVKAAAALSKGDDPDG